MIAINNNEISISQGNNAVIEIKLFNGSSQYTPAEGERLVFSLKKGIYDTKYILQKDIIDGVLTLTTSDTDLNLGKYVYDIALLGNNKKDTVIGPCNFYIKEVVNNAQSNS